MQSETVVQGVPTALGVAALGVAAGVRTAAAVRSAATRRVVGRRGQVEVGAARLRRKAHLPPGKVLRRWWNRLWSSLDPEK